MVLALLAVNLFLIHFLGIKEHLRIFEQTPAYRKLQARFPPVDIPVCRSFAWRTDEYWRCYIHYVSGSGCHPTSSCRMGSGPDDPRAVVDSRLRFLNFYTKCSFVWKSVYH